MFRLPGIFIVYLFFGGIVMEYGYVRVSSREQNIARQMESLKELGIDEKMIFVDRRSGKNFDRPAYKRLLQKINPGDVIIIKSIDRLGRNYDEILEQWRLITKLKQVDIFVIDFPLLDTRKKENDLTGTFVADLVLQILSYVAQTEREFIHQRQAEGIALAKQRGVQFGRKKLELPELFYDAKAQYEVGAVTYRKAAEMCGMSPSSFYRYAKTEK